MKIYHFIWKQLYYFLFPCFGVRRVEGSYPIQILHVELALKSKVQTAAIKFWEHISQNSFQSNLFFD